MVFIRPRRAPPHVILYAYRTTFEAYRATCEGRVSQSANATPPPLKHLKTDALGMYFRGEVADVAERLVAESDAWGADDAKSHESSSLMKS